MRSNHRSRTSQPNEDSNDAHLELESKQLDGSPMMVVCTHHRVKEMENYAVIEERGEVKVNDQA